MGDTETNNEGFYVFDNVSVSYDNREKNLDAFTKKLSDATGRKG